MVRHFLSVADIPPSELRLLTATCRNRKIAADNSLRGKIVGLSFERPSTRTRLSFYRAIVENGAFPVALNPHELQLATGETLRDTAEMLPLYLDALVVRCRCLPELEIFASQSRMAVINALTDEEHPTQAIADIITIEEALGRVEDANVLFIGEGGNIATSFFLACASLPGISVTFLTPCKYPLPQKAFQKAHKIGCSFEERIRESHDPRALPTGVDIVYTTRWRSMGEEKSMPNWREYFQDFQVTKQLLQQVGGSKPALLMHDLPAEREAEITAEALDGSFELVARQASHKVLAAKVALTWCLGEGI